MADAQFFKVNKDTALPRAIRKYIDVAGEEQYETEGIAYEAGRPVAAKDIDPRLLERLENGDEHLNSILEPISESEFDKLVAERIAADPGTATRAAEHTSEAYILTESGRDILSTDDALAVKSEGADEAGDVQDELLEAAGQDGLHEAEDADPIDAAAAKGKIDAEAEGEVKPARARAKKRSSGSKKKAEQEAGAAKQQSQSGSKE